MAVDRDTVIDAAAWVAATDSWHPVHMNHSRLRHNVVRYYQRAQGRVSFFASRWAGGVCECGVCSCGTVEAHAIAKCSAPNSQTGVRDA